MVVVAADDLGALETEDAGAGRCVENGHAIFVDDMNRVVGVFEQEPDEILAFGRFAGEMEHRLREYQRGGEAAETGTVFPQRAQKSANPYTSRPARNYR